MTDAGMATRESDYPGGPMSSAGASYLTTPAPAPPNITYQHPGVPPSAPVSSSTIHRHAAPGSPDNQSLGFTASPIPPIMYNGTCTLYILVTDVSLWYN